MKWEIINPSDPYTIEADDLVVAAIASVALGRGKYSLDPITEDTEPVPFFMFGGVDEWFEKHCGSSFECALDCCKRERRAELIACLESVTLTSAERSSMNDIGGRARAWAEALAKEEAGPQSPQRVFVR